MPLTAADRLLRALYASDHTCRSALLSVNQSVSQSIIVRRSLLGCNKDHLGIHDHERKRPEDPMNPK